MNLWRIAAETQRYAANDVSGAGAAMSPGRWNESGQPVLYTAPTIAMAVLETAAHVDDAGLPLNRYLVKITVPDLVWETRKILSIADLPVAWSAVPAGGASARTGSEWLRGMTTAVLEVPSVIVPEETAALINPLHEHAAGVRATTVRLFEYNRLFRRT